MVTKTIKKRSIQELPSSRHYSWLHSPFDATAWEISDPLASHVIDFDWALPDGTRLLDQENRPQLATIKAYAKGIREGTFAKTIDAYVQKTWVHNLIYILFWMRKRHIRAFKELTEIDIRLLIDDAKFGASRLIDAAGSLTVFFEIKRSPMELTKLPHRILPNGVTMELRTRDILDMAGLPKQFSRDERVAWVMTNFSKKLGFHVRTEDKKYLLDECPEHQVVNKETIRRLLRPLDDLYQMRFAINGDNITFDPFPNGLSTLAASLGQESGRTPTVPYDLAIGLLDRSARWVINHSEGLLDFRDSVQQHLQKEMASQRPKQLRSFKKSLLSRIPRFRIGKSDIVVSREREGTLFLNTALRYLFLACFILIAALTARRREEILLLEDNCISKDAEGYWLDVFIVKNQMEKTKIPCPKLVKKAVEVLTRLSKSARLINHSPILAQFTGIDPSIVLKPDISELNAFASFVAVPSLPDGTKWIFSSRQFRRLFAITYIWRWGGDVPSLGYMLRHRDLDRVYRYVLEAESGAIFADSPRYFTYEVMKSLALGKVTMGAPGGDAASAALRELKEDLEIRTKILDVDRLSGAVEQWVDNCHLILRQNPWVFCGCPTDHPTSEAICRHGCPGFGPNPQNASAITCSKCIFAFSLKDINPFCQHELKLSQQIYTDSRLPKMLREAAEVRADALRKIVNPS